MDHKKIILDIKYFHYKEEIRKASELRAKELINALKPFIGKKIGINGDTQLSKKVIDSLPKTKYSINPLNPDDKVSIQYDYIDVTSYSIWLKLSIIFSGGNGNYVDNSYYCDYERKNIYLGKMKDSVLIELFEIDNIVEKQVNVNEQINFITEYNEALIKLEDLRKKIII
jgi:hypothetical protein